MEVSMDFLQRMSLVVKRMILDTEAKKIIETKTFEIANAQCKRIIETLKAKSEHL